MESIDAKYHIQPTDTDTMKNTDYYCPHLNLPGLTFLFQSLMLVTSNANAM